MSVVKSLFLAIAAFELCSGGQQIPLDLLRLNEDAESHQGTNYVLGFIRTDIPAVADPDPVLFISTQDPRGADVTVEVPLATIAGFPLEFHIDQFETRKVEFPASIRVTTERDRGIHVFSRNDAKLDIMGVNDEVRSVDTFLALPCKLPRETGQNYYLSEYRYFVFSAFSADDTSTFLIIPCTSGGATGTNSVQYLIPGEDEETVLITQYETFLVASGSDLTGTVIRSPFPLAVFSGHQCGQIPEGAVACDTLVEQIPPDIVYGTRFFVLPFAVRESGDIIRVGSTIDNNEISITCNRREANGDSRRIIRTETINSGGFVEHRTLRRLDEPGLSGADYRRDFCCIESSKPAIVMQYMLGFSQDMVVFRGVAQSGDPAMTLVPPVEQYRNQYIFETPDDYIEGDDPDQYNSFISWAIATEFFDPIANRQDFFVNDLTFVPSERSTGGSADFIPFYCSNGEICGYGGTGAVGPGNYRAEYRSSDSLAGVYVSFYGLHREISYANPAGLECEPIGIPWITAYDVVVTEGVDMVANVIFNRTGGDLAIRTRVLASTREIASTDGRAMATSDFITVPDTRVVWAVNEVEARRGSPLSITIVDDDEAEPTETFEVHFFIDSTFSDSAGYAFPDAIARVTIIDNDGGAMCSLVGTEFTVAEGVGVVANIQVETTDPTTRSCLLTTMDGTAVAGSDYNALNMFPVMFTGARTTISIPIVNDDFVEPEEMFTVQLTSNDPDVTIGGPDTATVTITDSDRVSFGFEEDSYLVAEDGGSAQLVIVKRGQTTEDVILRFETQDGSSGNFAVSENGEDYTATTQDITFPASATRFTVSVPITNDNVVEPDEFFNAMISEVVEQADVIITRPMTQVTITNDDSVNFRFEEPTYTVSEGSGTANLVIVKDGAINQDIDLTFTTADGTAIGGADYTPLSMNITFPASDTRFTVSVPITDDDDTEPAEIFTAMIAEVFDSSAVTILQPTTEVTIEDNDAIPVVVQFDPTEYLVTEGGIVNFMLRLSEPTSEVVTVEVFTIDDTADGADYFGVTNLTVSFPAGSTEASFQVMTVRDTTAEGLETFRAMLSDPVGAILGDDEATATLRDAISVEFQPTSYSVTEGGAAMLTAVLSSPSQSDVTVRYSTRDVTATAPGDYGTIVDMLITFPAGTDSFTFPVPTQDDDIFENQERFEVFLSDPSGDVVLGSNNVATVDIDDNDPVSISLDPLSQDVTEGGDAIINVILSNPADREITVAFDTQDDTADSSDYTSISMVLTFPAGTTTRSVTIPTTADDVSELQESFTGVLSGATPGVAIATPQATVNILAQPLSVMIFPDNYDVNEGEDAEILLVLSSTADREVTVDFNTRDGSATGGADYDITSTTVTFAPGQMTRTVTVPTNTDLISELQESFSGGLSNPSTGLTITGGDATVNILPQTVEVGFDPATYTVTEGDTIDVTVRLSMEADRDVTVRYNTEDDTALAPGDYSPSMGLVTIPAGTLTQTITLSTVEDETLEGMESFGAVLTSPSQGVTIGQDTAEILIIDDDSTMINFDPITYDETEGGTATLMVVLSSPSDRLVTVDITTRDGSATDDSDYTPQTTTLTFNPGQTLATLDVPISNDGINELDEFFNAVLSNPSEGAALGPDSEATVNIADVDRPLTVQFGETTYSVDEGDQTSLVIVLNRVADRDVEVDLSTSDGTAAAPGDYASVSTRVVIPAGQTSVTVPVSAVDDILAEPDETFGASLSNPSEGVMVGPDSTATVNIIDQDDLTVSVERPDYTVPEPDEEVEVCLVLSSPASETFSVFASAVNSNPVDAQDGMDYTAEQREFVFTAGSMRACTNFDIIDDSISENFMETFSIQIDMVGPNNLDAQIGDTPSSTVTILDDDDLRVTIEEPRYRVPESDGPLEVCLGLNYETDQPFTATVFVRENDTQDAIDGEDFLSDSISVTFQPGSQRECIEVDIINDEIVETPDEEIFIVEVIPDEPNPYRASSGPNSEVPVTIVDDDMVRVRISQPEYSVNEGDGTVTVCVTRDGQTTDPITVTLNTRQGTATAGMDYTTVSTSLTIQPEDSMECTNIPIIDDPLAMEGDETFEVTITPPDNIPADETPSTVTISDNDEILLNFEDPAISVNEDVPGGILDVCFTPDSPSAQDYTVQLARRPTPPNPATAGLDYTVNMDDLTITISAGDAVEYCVPVGIVDDDVPLEPREAFTFNFTSLPEGVDRGSVPESRVTIFDDDDTVTLTPNNPTVPEGGGPTPFCVMLPEPPAAQEIRAEVVIQASSTTDFAPTSFTLIIPPGELMACMSIIAIDDKIALEADFVAPATVTIVSPRGLSGSPFSATVTLVDDDEVGVSFDTTRYTVSETDGSVTTCLNLNCPTAVPVDVVISAKDGSAQEGQDYDARTQTVTFPAGSQNQCADYVIRDDTLEEGDESFSVCIDSATPPGVNTTSGNSTTTVVIEDDDMVSVRLTEDNYSVDEDAGTVEVCVERVGQTTQDIDIVLFTGETSPAEAEDGQDFNSGVFPVTIRSTDTEACAQIPITDDDLALEGDERFQVSFTPPSDFPEPTPSTITIVDDDVPDVFFTTPEVVVREDSGTSQVCVNSNTMSARPYTVTLSHASSGSNPATAGMDYTVNMADLTVTFPAGAPVEQCVPFNPVDDDLAREGNETFRFSIDPSPEISIGSPDMSEVTIIENDFDVEVNFVSEDVRVNEDNGTVTVCVMRDRLTEGPLTVPIAITQGSAGSSDYRETVTDVTFAPGSSMTCAEIPIVDDTEEESSENFVVGFGSSTEFQPGPRATSEVTIIDDDEPATSSCVLRDSYVVSPFNNGQGYTYRGSCEIVAIQSCNDTERDFSVRVDYITQSSDLGAVGVHKDEYTWVSREDGEFVSTARGEMVGTDGSVFYPFNDVRVTRNTTARRTIISVGDGIDVTIVHNYGDDGSISYSVGSGSSLLETCGICGTQSGQLIDLNGFIATTPAERLRVAESYRTEARYQSLRPIRTECTLLCNDTVIGDPLFTVPFLNPPGEPRRSLCYEIHGRPNTHFNLVSDTCVSVNALYTGVSTVDGPLNIIGSIGVRAQDNLGNCQNIRVDLDQCAVSVGVNGALTSIGSADYAQDGISIRQRMTDRVRVSVPNCENVPLSMWVICERGNPVDMIRFQISRGKNLRSTSHGLVAQFWNVMVRAQQFTPPPGSSMEHDADKLYNVTVQAADDPNDPDHSPMPPYRSFLGDLFPRTWDNSREECLYVGNGQGGPTAEFPIFRDSVIEGRYSDYIVDSIFATDFAYDRIGGNCPV